MILEVVQALSPAFRQATPGSCEQPSARGQSYKALTRARRRCISEQETARMRCKNNTERKLKDDGGGGVTGT
jgi:hypothetical protein